MKLLTLMIREDKMQLPKQTEFGLKTTINRGHTLGPLKNTYPCDPTRKTQLPKQTESGLKTTINRGHPLGPLKNTYPCDPIRKMQLPKQTEFGPKQPLTEDTPSDLAQPCEH